MAGGHLDAGRVSQIFGLQGSQWAHDQTWGHRWWSYAVWIWPLVTALWAVWEVARALRMVDANRAWAAALGGLVAMLVLGSIVIAGTPGVLSATMGQGQSRVLFSVVFVIPIPALLAGAAATAPRAEQTSVTR
jgi:hypothetical protein